MNKYGLDNFEWKIIDDSAQNLDQLNSQEEYYIQLYNSFIGDPHHRGGYNMTIGGTKGIMTGKHISEEHRQKIIKYMTGRTRSEEYKRHISESHKGRPNNRSGYKPTESTKIKMSKSMIGKNKGKVRSAEFKKKISEANLGKKLSNDTRKKMSESKKQYYRNKRGE